MAFFHDSSIKKVYPDIIMTEVLSIDLHNTGETNPHVQWSVCLVPIYYTRLELGLLSHDLCISTRLRRRQTVWFSSTQRWHWTISPSFHLTFNIYIQLSLCYFICCLWLALPVLYVWVIQYFSLKTWKLTHSMKFYCIYLCLLQHSWIRQIKNLLLFDMSPTWNVLNKPNR